MREMIHCTSIAVDAGLRLEILYLYAFLFACRATRYFKPEGYGVE